MANGVFTSDVAAVPAVSATGTNGASGVTATSDSGTAVKVSVSYTGAESAVTIDIDNGTGTARGIGITANTQLGTCGQFNTSGGIGIQASAGLPVGGNPEIQGIAVQASGNVGVQAFGQGVNEIVPAGFDSANVAVQAFGDTTGVQAASTTGIGVHAVGGGASPASPAPISQAAIFAEGGPGDGVYATSSTSNGVFGTQTSATGDDEDAGVFGSSLALNGNGVIGEANNGREAYGVWGRSTSGFAGLFDGNVQVNGNLAATGTKPFIQAHPTDPSKEIVYVALEGGEAGTYVRGTGQLVNGKAMIALPEHFALVTDHQDLTIQLTPRGTWLQLYVVELDTAQLGVREAQGQSGAFDYLIHGIRTGYADHEVIRTKR